MGFSEMASFDMKPNKRKGTYEPNMSFEDQ